MKLGTIKVASVVTLLFLLGSAAHTPSQPPQDPAIRELVAREATTEFGVWRTQLWDIRPEQITLRPIELATPGVQLWEALPPTDHWHRYVVARREGRLWRLGGFADNDLVDFYNSLRREAGWGLRGDERSKYLIALVDPNGGELVYPTSGTGEVSRQWFTRRTPNWPADTVAIRADGSSTHRITVLSRQEHSYDQPWIPMVFTFSFDADGTLRTWSRREGAGSHVVAQPVSNKREVSRVGT